MLRRKIMLELQYISIAVIFYLISLQNKNNNFGKN